MEKNLKKPKRKLNHKRNYGLNITNEILKRLTIGQEFTIEEFFPKSWRYNSRRYGDGL